MLGNPAPYYPITSLERDWLAHCARSLGVETPAVREDQSVHDIAYTGSGGAGGTILLGRLFLSQRPNSFSRLRKICHENLHNVGIPHDGKARGLGYYSKQRRDNFSRQVTHRLLADFSGVGEVDHA